MEKRKIRYWSIINVIALAAVIVVNGLAVTLPLNGISTGDISDLYPNMFVPAGFTFSIWSLIYLLLLCFCIYSTGYSFGKNEDIRPYQILVQLSPYFFVICILNITWIFMWHYLQIGFSVVVMLLFLCTLTGAFKKLHPYTGKLPVWQNLFLKMPFVVYLGWISVATIANITALLVHLDWQGFGISQWLWSCIMIATAAALGFIFAILFKEPAYTLVICWAMFGIYYKQIPVSNEVGYMALIATIVMIICAMYKLIAQPRMVPPRTNYLI